MPRRRSYSQPYLELEGTPDPRPAALQQVAPKQEGLSNVLGMLGELYGLQESQEKLREGAFARSEAAREAPYKRRLMQAETEAYGRRGGADLRNEFETLMGLYGRPDDQGVMRLPPEISAQLIKRHGFVPPRATAAEKPKDVFTSPTGKTAADPAYDAYASDPEFAALMPRIQQRQQEQSAESARRTQQRAAFGEWWKKRAALMAAKKAAGIDVPFAPGIPDQPITRQIGRTPF